MFYAALTETKRVDQDSITITANNNSLKLNLKDTTTLELRILRSYITDELDHRAHRFDEIREAAAYRLDE